MLDVMKVCGPAEPDHFSINYMCCFCDSICRTIYRLLSKNRSTQFSRQEASPLECQRDDCFEMLDIPRKLGADATSNAPASQSSTSGIPSVDPRLTSSNLCISALLTQTNMAAHICRSTRAR
jgi:hypothetical protein